MITKQKDQKAYYSNPLSLNFYIEIKTKKQFFKTSQPTPFEEI